MCSRWAEQRRTSAGPHRGRLLRQGGRRQWHGSCTRPATSWWASPRRGARESASGRTGSSS
eukprot:10589719-Lingulodinium_polyedra.AAC.1